MAAFDELLAKLNSVTGEGDALLDCYTSLWREGMLLSGEQYKEIVHGLLKIKKTTEQSKCHDLLTEGVLYTFHPSYGNGIDKLTEAIEAFKKINNKGGEGAVQSLFVIHHKNNGALGKAQEYVQASIQNIGEDKTYLQFMMVNYYQAGEIHHLLKDYDAAITYYNTGLTYATDNPGFETRLYAGIGTVYRDNNESEKAHDYFKRALELSIETDNFVMESRTYADIGNYHFQKQDFEQAVSFQQKSIALRQQHNIKNPLITNYIELAEAYQKLNKPEKALNNALLAEKLAKEQNNIPSGTYSFTVSKTGYGYENVYSIEFLGGGTMYRDLNLSQTPTASVVAAQAIQTIGTGTPTVHNVQITTTLTPSPETIEGVVFVSSPSNTFVNGISGNYSYFYSFALPVGTGSNVTSININALSLYGLGFTSGSTVYFAVYTIGLYSAYTNPITGLTVYTSLSNAPIFTSCLVP